MEHVNKLKNKLSTLNALKIAYAVIPIDAAYDEQFYQDFILSTKIPRNYFDSFNSTDINNDNKSYNMTSIVINENDIVTFNDSIIELKDLSNNIKRFINKYPKYLFKLNISDNMTFSTYINSLSIIFNSFIEKRNEYSLKQYSKSFDDLNEDQQRVVSEIYPYRLLESKY